MLTKLRLLKKIDDLSTNPCLENVFQIVKLMVRRYPSAKVRHLEDKLRQNQDFQAFWDRYSSSESELRKPWNEGYLSSLPAGTLGREVWDFWQRNKITQAELMAMEEDNLLKVVANRLIKTHDVWHVLVGYEITPNQEYGLQAFYLGQEASLATFAIMSAGFWRVLKIGRAKDIRELMNGVSFGYQQGLNSHKLLYVIWEDFWEEPLDQIRQRFKIQQYLS